MRTRWIAGIFAASTLALVTAASLAQRAERPRMAVSPPPNEAPTDRKAWRSKAEPQDDRPPAPPIERVQAAEDPMVAVETFLRRNRKEADDSIQALTREAEALRARLAKVEAALARWQAIAGSLNPGQKWAQPDGPSEPGPDPAPIETAPRPSAGAKSFPGPPPPSTTDPVSAPGPVTPPPGGEAPPPLPGVPPPIAEVPAPPK